MSLGDHLFLKRGEELKVARIYAAYMQKFRFFFQDTLDIIRSYPEIGKMHQQQVAEETNIIRNLIYIGAGKGIFVPEPVKGMYSTLASTIWQTMHFWFARQAICGETDEGLEQVILTIYNLLYPFFTEVGQEDYHRMIAAVSSLEETL